MNIFAHAGHDHAAEVAQAAGISPSMMAIGGIVFLFVAVCLLLFLKQK